MASLFRNSKSLITRFACIHRNAATVVAHNTGTQVKTSGNSAGEQGNLTVRETRRRLSPADPIKPRAASEPLIPLVGTSLNTWGQIGFGIVLAISAYFFYINYVTNPEFYKSLKISREASKRSAQEHSAHGEGAGGHKSGDAKASKGEPNKH